LRRLWTVAWIAGACLLLACSRQEAGWRAARDEDSLPAYETYLQQFPVGAHAAEARARMRELLEDHEWERAMQSGRPEAYQRYLSAFPEGRYAGAARERLSEFVLSRAPALPAVQSAVTAGPNSVQRPYGVQLGAYSNEASARAGLARLTQVQASLPEGLEPRILPPAPGAPRVWRLRAGPLDEAAARGLCAELALRGMDCVPVAE
jgi:hypothetical protein